MKQKLIDLGFVEGRRQSTRWAEAGERARVPVGQKEANAIASLCAESYLRGVNMGLDMAKELIEK